MIKHSEWHTKAIISQLPKKWEERNQKAKTLELYLDVKARVGRDRMSGHIASVGGNVTPEADIDKMEPQSRTRRRIIAWPHLACYNRLFLLARTQLPQSGCLWEMFSGPFPMARASGSFAQGLQSLPQRSKNIFSSHLQWSSTVLKNYRNVLLAITLCKVFTLPRSMRVFSDAFLWCSGLILDSASFPRSTLTLTSFDFIR